ncbi:uncharacterized protein HRG_08612 [Hirsutella rhossiliensis]|uniref:Amine oxidase domain-containing protein n=1 Tax=Hirsutella rhossiliensis TaxID=111463 RepID=A0A9P8MSV9_9HYPO|nr:uncharacterized protein HRG_08612 [Hirsutella rhossiliensis]KAH0960457.1 hypothetical protein HRG_08612 [Hirsutella rhossiliensis]
MLSSSREQHFDRVVLAVSPDVAARVFWPLASTLHEMPTKRVESYILSSEPGALSIASGQDSVAGCSHHCGEAWPAQVITVRTQFDGDASRTQALHAMPGGALVSTCLPGDGLEGGVTDCKLHQNLAHHRKQSRSAEHHGLG